MGAMCFGGTINAKKVLVTAKVETATRWKSCVHLALQVIILLVFSTRFDIVRCLPKMHTRTQEPDVGFREIVNISRNYEYFGKVKVDFLFPKLQI